jgi:hypothetical protein
MRFSRIFFFWSVMVLALPGVVEAQVDPLLPPDLQNLIEEVAASREGEIDHTYIVEDLQDLFHQPLNINMADAEALDRLHLLTPFQIQSLIRYRERYGPLLSIYELPVIYGFTAQLAQKMEPFITVGAPSPRLQRPLPKLDELFGNSRKHIILRSGRTLEQQKGFLPPSPNLTHQTYPGSPLRVYSQLGLKYHNRLSLGATLDKDPGETFLREDNPWGFDFHSAHLFLQEGRWMNKLALGDYDIRYGQGLIAWSGLAFSKSSMVLNLARHAAAIDPYTSANENNFFRGVAMEKKWLPLTLSVFYSDKYIDANLQDTTSSGRKVFSSFQESGYHRLSGELFDERSVRERVLGGSLSYNRGRLKVGFNGIHYFYDGLMIPAPRPENTYRFSGGSNTNLSLDYHLSLNRFYFFGEQAWSLGEGQAFLNGLHGRLTPGVGMCLLHRYYERDYQAIYGSAFAEGPRPQNEHGIYLGLEVEVGEFLQLRSYIDTWRFPWLTYSSAAPSTGWEGMVQLDYTPRKGSMMYLRFQRKSSSGSRVDAASGLMLPQEAGRSKLRYHFRYQLTHNLVSDTRLEYVDSRSDGTSRGAMVCQDIGFHPGRFPFRFDVRLALFDTDDYASRIYAYEDDLLYVFSVPPYYSRGYRTYLNMKYSAGRTDLWLKLARTGYADKQTIGSGLNEIRGPNKTTLYMQMRLRF